MKKFNSYDKVEAYKEVEKLPVGGYVCKILGTEEVEYDWGNVLVVSFDIAEGDYKDYYKHNYAAQTQEDKKWKGTYRLNVPKDDGSEKDEWTARRFKTDIQAVEDSNKGFHWNWDETELKNKMVGIVFQNKEYEYNGNRGFFTNPYSFRSVDDIRNGKFKIPADKLLDNKKTSQQSGNIYEFTTLDDDADLPF